MAQKKAEIPKENPAAPEQPAGKQKIPEPPASKDAQPNKDQPAVKQAPSQERVQLKRGDYSVHIFLEEAKALVPTTPDETIDPIVTLQVFGQKKYTKPMEDVGSSAIVSWDEHFFFDKAGMEVEEVEQTKILIEIRDHRFMLHDSLIGNYEIDMSYVYYQEDHCIAHKWVALSNPKSEDFQKVMGYVKLGIAVVAEGDMPGHLEVEQIEDDTEILLPPQINMKSCQLIIRLLKATNLPKLDSGNDIMDGFVVADFAGASIKSKTIKADKATKSCYWYEDLYIPVVVPTVSTKVTLTLWDYDSMSANDLVGAINFDWEDIVANIHRDFFWANLYGAPQNCNDGSQSTRMNRNTHLASNWRGRVLLSMWVEDVKKPSLKAQLIEDESVKDIVRENFETGTEWELRAQVRSGVGLPSWKSEYSVIVNWGEIELKTQPKKVKNGRADWYENMKRKIVFVPNKAEESLQDLIVYLVNGDTRAAFCRINPMTLTDKATRGQWVVLKADPAVNEIKHDWECGYIHVRIYIGLYDEDNDDTTTGNWNKAPVYNPGNKYNVLVNLYQCRSLPPSDSNGLSDPYVIMYCGGVTVMTEKEGKLGTLNPMWYQSYKIEVDFDIIENAPPVMIKVMDYDTMSSDDLLGMCVVSMETASLNKFEATRPQWYHLKMGDESSSLGEILISLNLYAPGEMVAQYNIVPECEDTNVEINILGLRELVSAVGWIPVHKPFIKFDLNSLQIPGEDLSIRNIETQPGDTGPNPNINAIIKFDCKLPKDPLFCPSLTCAVYDYLFKGLSQPLIGTFSINLGEIYHERVITRQKTSRYRIFGKMLWGAVRQAEPFHEPKSEDAHKVVIKDLFNRENVEFGKQLAENIALTDTGTNLTVIQEEFVEASQTIPEVPQKLQQPISSPKHLQKKSSLQSAMGKLLQKSRSIQQELASKFVIWPQFETDAKTKITKEINVPDLNHYVQLGHNKTPEDKIMHYRYCFAKELEETEFLDDNPFLMFDIIRGKRIGDSLQGSQEHTLNRAGFFKGMIRMSSSENAELRRERPQAQVISDPYDEDAAFDDISRRILIKQDCLVRIYMIDAFGLTPKDRGSMSDPYLKLKLGKKLIDERDHYEKNNANPQWFKCFEFKAQLPGISVVKIQVWDYNTILEDQLIGQTSIDLEDRFFSQKWCSLADKPIETRHLYHKSSKIIQGSVRLFVEIVPARMPPPQISISPKPKAKFEARLIVWNTLDVESADMEGTSDIFVRAWVNGCEPKETDTHYRCQTGSGSFNWRLVFPITLPSTINVVNLQIWDRDVVSFNDFLGDASFTFNTLARTAFQRDIRVKKYGSSDKMMDRLRHRETEKFVVQCRRRNKEFELEDGGKVVVSFELVPEEMAQRCPVGEGRNEPNVDPYLPPPVGRFEWSWNPCKLISQLCGPEFRMKICLCICCLLCIIILAFVTPMVFSNVMGNLISG